MAITDKIPILQLLNYYYLLEFLKMNYSIRSQCKNRAKENAKLNIKYISNINTFRKKSLILVDMVLTALIN